jgi:putative Holliday junction resolvase
LRILGIDFGDVHVGLALSDPLQLTAQPLGQYRLRGEAEDKAYFGDLIRAQQVSEIVIGFPLRMDGTSGTRAEKTRTFASWMEKAYGLPVILWDERLTTRQAGGIMREQRIRTRDRRSIEHQISAVLILQAYLDSRRTQSHVPQDH